MNVTGHDLDSGTTPVGPPTKRVILSMGGKGGVGKTSVILAWPNGSRRTRFRSSCLDLDTENKARGSLTHFFGGKVPKVNIHTPAGLDAFVDELTDGPPVILADMGAGAGQVTYDWFDKMYSSVAEAGIVFTSVGVITSDPASVESVLAWASRWAIEPRTSSLRTRSLSTPTSGIGGRASRRSVFSRLFAIGDPHGFPAAGARERHKESRRDTRRSRCQTDRCPGVAEVFAGDARAELSQTDV